MTIYMLLSRRRVANVDFSTFAIYYSNIVRRNKFMIDGLTEFESPSNCTIYIYIYNGVKCMDNKCVFYWF